MLVLFETPAGYALFKVLNEGKLQQENNIYKEFQDPDSSQKMVGLKAFRKFENTTEALAAATALVESKMDSTLKKFLKDSVVKKDLGETLAVSDAKLGGIIKEKLGIKCLHNSLVNELIRGIRSQVTDLLGSGVGEGDMKSMALGLSHSLGRYKLKFSPDKVDVMIVQAIALLDDLDKELNTYAMRCKEWYGWHFPEMTKILSDNIVYAKAVKLMGMRSNALTTDFSDILPEEIESELKEAAKISMGTEISEEDLLNITELCNQVIDIHEYREQLFEYLKNRMQAIAPNLSVMVGELVGARLIAHAGSLINLAKYPASTVQILGAEKALFRALKTKHETPKYGLIYHASLVGQAAPKNKGKVSRIVAAKAALAIRVDALGENVTAEIGMEGRAKVESRMRQLEGGQMHAISNTGGKRKSLDKYDSQRSLKNPSQARTSSSYNAAADSTLSSMDVVPKAQTKEEKKKGKKRKQSDEEEEEEENVKESKQEKKKKKKKADKGAAAEEENGKKKKKKKTEGKAAENGDKKEKKKKKKTK
ncbi:Ribosomal RNA processing protein 1 A [Balamuthia mandrillaris]